MGKLAPIRAPDKEVLTIAEVARLTGYSKATIYKLTCERKIPFYKPEHGGRRLYLTARLSSTGCKAIRLQPSNRNVPHILTPLNQGQRYEKFRKNRGIIWIRI